MILQRLHSEYGLKIELVLIREYKRLGLTMKELNVLVLLFENYPRRRTFSVNSLSRKSDYTQNEVAAIFNELLEKDFVTLLLEQKTDKTREIYSLDNTFKKISDMLLDDEKQKLISENKSSIAFTIELLEQKLNRLLNVNELDRVRTWYENLNYSHENITKAIKAAKNNINVLYIEKLLDANVTESKPLDDKTSELLDKIYKGL